MKVLMVNTYDQRGGAARSTRRVFRELKASGVDIQLMVQNKQGNDPDVLGPKGWYGRVSAELRPYLDFAIGFPWHRKRIPFFPALVPGNFLKRVEAVGPDLVHLNWIAGGMLKLEDLARLQMPVVWTLHDMWAFTGGCHYAEDCTRYLGACGACPLLKSKIPQDLSRWNFNRKQRTYDQISNLTIITPSRWLAGCVKDSPLLGRFPVEVIPNSLDTRVFFPEEKMKARQHFGLGPDKKIVLFGALDATRNKLKGFTQLSEALKRLTDKEGVELAVFGSGRRETASLFGFRVHYLGFISGDDALRKLYTAADVMVVPSIQEVFGQTATEAMACGTPVVAFAATGLLDIVEHQYNGYLAEPFEPDDLAAGISWCIADPERNRQLSENAVDTVKKKFDIQKNIQRITNLYQRILNSGNQQP